MYAHTTWPPPGATSGSATSAPNGTSGFSALAARRDGSTTGRWGR
ncbi:hypothetical protein ACFUJR_22810 [Streptomyces sp. NPDC057271]